MKLEKIGLFVSLLFLFWLGYVCLKEGLHFDTAKEKMIKAFGRTMPKKLPRFYLIVLGVFSFFGALYFAFRILLKI